MADWMEPTVQERMTDMVDREAVVVCVEKMGKLEMEDEVEQRQRG